VTRARPGTEPCRANPATAWVDLTLPITDGMPSYPGEPTARFQHYTTIERDQVAMASVGLFSQLGTHVDAPAHFIPGGRTVDELDLSDCIGEAIVIRLGPLEPGSVIEETLLEAHLDRLRGAARVILSTGWSSHAGSHQYFTNWPRLSLGAAHLLAGTGIRLLGLDTPSPGDDTNNVALHQLLLADNRIMVECLVNIDALPADRFTLICLPLPLVGLDGSPVRALASTAPLVFRTMTEEAGGSLCRAKLLSTPIPG
jgi:arylformamidase